MRLVLVRHGVAFPHNQGRYPNDDRPLTREGIARLERSAHAYARLVTGKVRVISSPLKRAKETADILAGAFGAECGVSKALLPAAPPPEAIEELLRIRGVETVVLVGHEPHLSALLRILTGLRPARAGLKKGGAAVLTFGIARGRVREVTLRAFLTPKLLKGLKRVKQAS